MNIGFGDFEEELDDSNLFHKCDDGNGLISKDMVRSEWVYIWNGAW